MAGLATALALHDTGWRVVVLEGSAPPPQGPVEMAAGGWWRPAVPHAQHSHTLTSLGMRVLQERAPGLLRALLEAGAGIHELPEDPRVTALGCRRTVLELVMYRFVRPLPGVEIRHHTPANGLALDGTVVKGVSTADGVVRGDIVVDATGRRAQSRRWLGRTDPGAPAGLNGYTRFYLRRECVPPGPLNRGYAAGAIWEQYSAVLHPGDGRVFSVAFGVLPGDAALARLREEARFERAARAIPFVRDWLAAGAEPISKVHAIACHRNAFHAFAEEQPVTGLYPVGDAACVTNPLFGRGLSLALAHAFLLAELLANGNLGSVIAKQVEALLLPWFEHTLTEDSARAGRWRAAWWRGEPAAPTTPAPATPLDPATRLELTRMLMGLRPPAGLPPMPLAPGAPSREELLSIMDTGDARDAGDTV